MVKQFPVKLIPKIIYNILNKKEIPIYAKGKNSREWIYVEDHCEALIALAKTVDMVTITILVVETI